jgi:MFS family permease
MAEAPRDGHAVFRYPDFRFYVAGRVLQTLAQQIQNIALAWLIYDLTHDPLALGFIGLANFLPTIPLSLVTGTVADRFDRRMIVVIFYALPVFGAAAMVALASLHIVWPAYGVVILIATSRAFANPAGQAMMASIVPEREYSSAVAWANTINQIGTVVGPSIGGLLYPLGATVPFIVAFACFAVSTVMAIAIRPHPAKGDRKAPVTWATLVAGYRFIWVTPVILGVITLDLVAVLLGGAVSLLPIYAGQIFHTGSLGLGILRSSPAIGSILMGLALARFPLSRKVGRTMFICVIIYGLATIGFGLSGTMEVAVICLVVLGGADVTSVVIRQSLIQIETPDEMRGRVMAVHNILTGTSNNLGDFESGAVARLVGPVAAVVIGGAGAVVAALVWMRLFPSLRKRERF